MKIQAGQHVHKEYRGVYTNPHEIQKAQREKKIKCTTETPNLRSQSQLFKFRNHCFICGQAVKGTEREVYPVRTNHLQTNNLKVCQEQKDDWAVAVRGLAASISGQVRLYQKKKDENRGRPKNDLKENHFKKLVDYLHQHDDEQIKIKDLANKINNLFGENVYSTVHMKK